MISYHLRTFTALLSFFDSDMMIFKGSTLFSKMCPIFVGSVDNFGKSDDDQI